MDPRRAATSTVSDGLGPRRRLQLRVSALGELELGRDVDAAADAAGDRAPCRVGVVGPLDRRSVGIGRHVQLVANVDPLDHEDLVLEFDFPLGVAAETTVPGGDAACFQRTPERAGQSTGGGRHHVIEGGGVRFEAALVGAVVRGDGAVTPKATTPSSAGRWA
jgi:hypothetical protein